MTSLDGRVNAVLDQLAKIRAGMSAPVTDPIEARLRKAYLTFLKNQASFDGITLVTDDSEVDVQAQSISEDQIANGEKHYATITISYNRNGLSRSITWIDPSIARDPLIAQADSASSAAEYREHRRGLLKLDAGLVIPSVGDYFDSITALDQLSKQKSTANTSAIVGLEDYFRNHLSAARESRPLLTSSFVDSMSPFDICEHYLFPGQSQLLFVDEIVEKDVSEKCLGAYVDSKFPRRIADLFDAEMNFSASKAGLLVMSWVNSESHDSKPRLVVKASSEYLGSKGRVTPVQITEKPLSKDD